mgnify:CR=1 FL=1
MTNQVLTGDTATESVTETTARYLKTRHLKDVMTRYMMAVGGIGVIIAIVLIAVYLFYVVVPMFMPAEVDLAAEYRAPGDSSADTLYYAMEEQAEIGLRADNQGKLVFFDVSDGRVLQEHDVLPDSDAAITAFDAGDPSQELLAYGLSDGSVLLVQHRYKITYPDDKRLISPGLYYPMGREPTRVSEDGSAITQVSAQYDGDNTTIAAVTANSELHLVSLAREESFLSDEAEITRSDAMLPLSRRASHMILDVDQRELYLANDDGSISYYDTSDKSAPVLIEHVQRVVPDDVRITSLEFLSGGISVLVGDSRGHINQWFPVRDENNDYSLQWVRGFSAQDLYGLFHDAENAQHGQTDHRDHGSPADGDPGFSGRAVAGAVCRIASPGYLYDPAAVAGQYPARFLRLVQTSGQNQKAGSGGLGGGPVDPGGGAGHDSGHCPQHPG